MIKFKKGEKLLASDLNKLAECAYDAHTNDLGTHKFTTWGRDYLRPFHYIDGEITNITGTEITIDIFLNEIALRRTNMEDQYVYGYPYARPAIFYNPYKDRYFNIENRPKDRFGEIIVPPPPPNYPFTFVVDTAVTNYEEKLLLNKYSGEIYYDSDLTTVVRDGENVAWNTEAIIPAFILRWDGEKVEVENFIEEDIVIGKPFQMEWDSIAWGIGDIYPEGTLDTLVTIYIEKGFVVDGDTVTEIPWSYYTTDVEEGSTMCIYVNYTDKEIILDPDTHFNDLVIPAGKVYLPLYDLTVYEEAGMGRMVNVERHLAENNISLSESDNFEIVSVKDTGSGYTCRVTPGYLVNRNPAGGTGSPPDALTKYMPYIGEVLMNEGNPTVSFTSGQSIYLRVQTDEKDQVKIVDGKHLVEIVADTAEKESVAYQPPFPDDAGSDGDYYYLIGTITADTTDPDNTKFTIEQVQGDGPIFHGPDGWQGTNVGGGSRVYKQRNASEDLYEFRSIVGRHGINSSELFDEVWLNQDNENMGGGEEVWMVPEGNLDPEDYPQGTSKFRTIRPLFSGEIAGVNSPQVNVETVDGESSDPGSADTIRIHGNGINRDITNSSSVSMTVVDGLVTELTSGGVGSGENLNLEVYNQEWIATTASGVAVVNFINVPTSPSVIHYWRDGIYIGNVDPLDAPVGLITQKVTYLQTSS